MLWSNCSHSTASVFVHRDYHSRNLMVTEDNNPGILDFQDAVEGPHAYDLVSLLKDCYIKPGPHDFVQANVQIASSNAPASMMPDSFGETSMIAARTSTSEGSGDLSRGCFTATASPGT